MLGNIYAAGTLVHCDTPGLDMDPSVFDLAVETGFSKEKAVQYAI